MLKYAAIQAFMVLGLLGQGATASVQSSSFPDGGSPTPVRTQDTYLFAEVETRLHEQHPEYIGFEVYDGTLFLAVNSTDAAVRLRILRAVQASHAPFLQVLQAHPGRVRFLQGSADAEHLAAASDTLKDVRGLTFVHRTARVERLVIGLLYPSQRDEAEAAFHAAGVPLDAVLIVTPAPGVLPTGPALDARYEAALQVPATIRQGEDLPITLSVRNVGPVSLEFEYGACDFHVEIWKVAPNEVILPLPSGQACIAIGYQAIFPPGRTQVLAFRKWKVETTDWKRLPPGEYEVRAAFGPLMQASANQAQYVPPTQYILPAPVRFEVLGL